MKKIILSSFVVILTALETIAFPVMTYSNKCVLGCNSVYFTTKWYEDPNGNPPFLGAEVKCTGFGFKSCPRKNIGPDVVDVSGVQLEGWESNPINTVVSAAWDEIDLGNGSGNYYVNYMNVSTGITYKYTITWATTYFQDGSVDEISYVIDRIQLPS